MVLLNKVITSFIILMISSELYADTTKTVVEVYEMSYAEADELQNNYKKLYNKTEKMAPSSSYVLSKGYKKDGTMSAKGVRVSFSKKQSNVKNFNAMLEITARFARTKLKGNNGKGMSRMLLEMKQ